MNDVNLDADPPSLKRRAVPFVAKVKASAIAPIHHANGKEPPYMKVSQYCVTVDGLVDRLLESCVIVYSTRTGESFALRTAFWDLIIDQNFDALDTELLAKLVDAQILVPSIDDELSCILTENTAAISDLDTLYLVVQPTRNCQLGCHYCGQTHNTTKLSSEHANNVISYARSKLRSKAVKYKHLRVCWFGAEPLLGLGQIRGLTSEFRQLADECNIKYSAKVVTNGLLLTTGLATELVDLHSVDHIEITLDGLARTHDSRRHTKKGDDTFDKIYGNVVCISKLGLPADLSIRCNTDDSNMESALELIDQLVEDGLSGRVRFYVAPVHSWGNDAHLSAAKAADFANFEVEVLDKLVSNGFNVSYIPGRKKITCMAVQPDSRLFSAEGLVYNCTEVSYVPKYNERDESLLGNQYQILNEKSLPHSAAKLADFQADLHGGTFPCSTCPILPVCGGSCPKQWNEGLIPCPPVKHNISQRLIRSHSSHVSVAEYWY